MGAWLLDHVWAPVMGLLALMVKNRFERVEAKAEAAVSKADFERHLQQSDRELKDYFASASKQRDELRDSVIKLFDRLDDLKTLLLHQQHQQQQQQQQQSKLEQRDRHA
jgi:uncharacterized membrane-anchored protein YhcB (DUF1043 family)